MSYERVPQDSYPPPGYGTQYPPPTAPPPPGYPPGLPPRPPPPPGYEGYPQPPQYHQQPPMQGGYQGYFNDAYPPSQPYPTTQVYHCEHYDRHDDGCLSFLNGCFAALCCCCMMEECCF